MQKPGYIQITFRKRYIQKTSPAIKVVWVFWCPLNIFSLTHYSQVLLTYTHWKHQKPGGIDKQHRAVMG